MSGVGQTKDQEKENTDGLPFLSKKGDLQLYIENVDESVISEKEDYKLIAKNICITIPKSGIPVWKMELSEAKKLGYRFVLQHMIMGQYHSVVAFFAKKDYYRKLPLKIWPCAITDFGKITLNYQPTGIPENMIFSPSMDSRKDSTINQNQLKSLYNDMAVAQNKLKTAQDDQKRIQLELKRARDKLTKAENEFNEKHGFKRSSQKLEDPSSKVSDDAKNSKTELWSGMVAPSNYTIPSDPAPGNDYFHEADDDDWVGIQPSKVQKDNHSTKKQKLDPSTQK